MVCHKGHEGLQWKFALECVLAAGLNEVLMKEPLNSLSSVCVSQSLSVFSLSPCLSSLSSLLGSQLAQFLWPFDLSERVWSFKVLVFPLSGASLFLLSGLGFQSGGSAVPWLGGLEGWEWVGWGGGSAGFYEVVRLRWGLRGGGGHVMLSASVRRGTDTWQIPIPSKTLSSHLTQPLVATCV